VCVGHHIYFKKKREKNKGHSSSGGGGRSITLLLCFAAAVVFGAFRIFLVLSLLPGCRRRRRFFQGSVQLLERGVHLIFSLGPVPLLVHPPHSLKKDRKIKNNTRCLGFSNKKNSVLIF
jgi:hypothetical protein